VMTDLIRQLESVVPWDGDYDHAEGNAAAHIKSVLLGSHQWIPVDDRELSLGRWQGVFLLEWDGPRERTVRIQPST
jgi:secondary thiamine-phosphate synthase enzyme